MLPRKNVSSSRRSHHGPMKATVRAALIFFLQVFVLECGFFQVALPRLRWGSYRKEGSANEIENFAKSRKKIHFWALNWLPCQRIVRRWKSRRGTRSHLCYRRMWRKAG